MLGVIPEKARGVLRFMTEIVLAFGTAVVFASTDFILIEPAVALAGAEAASMTTLFTFIAVKVGSMATGVD